MVRNFAKTQLIVHKKDERPFGLAKKGKSKTHIIPINYSENSNMNTKNRHKICKSKCILKSIYAQNL